MMTIFKPCSLKKGQHMEEEIFSKLLGSYETSTHIRSGPESWTGMPQ